MRTGEPVSAAPGKTSDKVLDLHGTLVMGTIRADVEPWSFYRARNYALFTNGLWQENSYIGSDSKLVRLTQPMSPGSLDNSSITVVEVGDHEQFDESNYVPGGWVKEEEAVDSARVRIQWTAGYLVDENNGENSLASVVLTGITRFGNCEPDDKFPRTRARVWYTIEAIGTTRIVRLWANGSLVCSGSRIGNGLVTFTENNGSGLTGSGILTYTADVIPNQAFLLLRWAGKYNIHYSKSALSYPRTPEMVVYDKGVSNYICLTPILTAGSWNYAVQAVGDDETEQSPVPVPSDSPKLIKVPPLPVTHGTPTGNAAAITLHWTAGESGCSYTVYYSHPDEPVNLGQWPYPLPILRPVGANSAVLPPITGYAPLDRTAAWNAFVASIDNVVTDMNLLFDISPWTYHDLVDAQEVIAKQALITLSQAVGIPTIEHIEQIALAFKNLQDISDANYTLTVPEWQVAVRDAMSSWLNSMSLIVDGNTQRYTFSDGSLPWSGTGTSDGDSGSNEAGGLVATVSVKAMLTPLVTNRVIRVIIRALRVSDGLQEVCDEVLTIELDSGGNIVLPRPNPCYISSMTMTNTTATFGLETLTDDQAVAAAYLAVYYAAAPNSPTYVSPAASAAVSSEVTGLVTASVNVTFPSPGYYVIGCRSISAAGTLSPVSKETTIWAGTEQPAGPTGIYADVIRSMPELPVEDD